MKQRIEHVLRLGAAPPVVVLLLVAANVAAYAACAYAGGGLSVPGRVLLAGGALTSASMEAGQYWRLLTYGFLHFDPIHLMLNLWWIVAVGPRLERRLGGAAFALLYGAAILGGGLATVWGFPGRYLTVGASGAALGLFGAEFALWILGKAQVPSSYFLTNFALNIAWTAAFPRINWAAHLGGFAAGMLGIALLDLAAKAAGSLFRCRFPEFVKANALLLLLAGAVQLWANPVQIGGTDPRLATTLAWALGAAASVKLLDLMLAARRGLAGIVLLFAACNAALAYACAALLQPTLDSACRSGFRPVGPVDEVAQLLCPASGQAPVIAAALACSATLLLLASPLRRGLHDVGFVGASLAGERRRGGGL